MGIQLLLICCSNAFYTVMPFLVALLIDSLASKKEAEYIIWLLVALAIVCVLPVVIERFRWWFEVKYIDNQVSDHIAGETLGKLVTLSISQHADENSLVTSSKVGSGESAIRSFIGGFLYQIIPTMFTVVLALIAMTISYPLVGAIAIMFALLVLRIGLKTGAMFAEPIEYWMDFRHKVVGKSGGELVRHMGSTILASEDERGIKRHMSHRRARKRMFQNIFQPFGKMISISMLTANIGRFVLVSVTVFAVYSGNYELGAVAAVMAWSHQSLGQLMQTQGLFRSLCENWGDIVHYFKIMDEKPKVVCVGNAKVLDSVEGSIIFENVVYTYPSASSPALNGVSLTIEPGSKVGIVGPSGAGKSTLLAMLQAADNPTFGRILIDGVPLDVIDHKSYRQLVAFVEQRSELFDRPLHQNMMFGLSDERRKTVTKDELEDVLRQLNLRQLISRLFERTGEFGKKLSGGEQQRIAIARALLKRPDMLVVDEGTSSVDPVSERLIHKALEAVSPGATRIFVAHRLATVADADKIFVMKEGSVVATGTHEELLASSELYQDLVNTQLLKV